MPSAQKPAGAEDAERALSRDQPSAAAAAAPTPANNGSASADGAEVISKEHQQNPLGNGGLLGEQQTLRCQAHRVCLCGDAWRPLLGERLSLQWRQIWTGWRGMSDQPACRKLRAAARKRHATTRDPPSMDTRT